MINPSCEDSLDICGKVQLCFVLAPYLSNAHLGTLLYTKSIPNTTYNLIGERFNSDFGKRQETITLLDS